MTQKQAKALKVGAKIQRYAGAVYPGASRIGEVVSKNRDNFAVKWLDSNAGITLYWFTEPKSLRRLTLPEIYD